LNQSYHEQVQALQAVAVPISQASNVHAGGFNNRGVAQSSNGSNKDSIKHNSITSSIGDSNATKASSSKSPSLAVISQYVKKAKHKKSSSMNSKPLMEMISEKQPKGGNNGYGHHSGVSYSHASNGPNMPHPNKIKIGPSIAPKTGGKGMHN
jgi:hypothetical protein